MFSHGETVSEYHMNEKYPWTEFTAHCMS